MTKTFPTEEVFGLTAQLRRAVVCVAPDIVERCTRHSQSDYLRFLDMACSSAREVEDHLSLASCLGYLSPQDYESLRGLRTELSRVLSAPLLSLRKQ